MPLLLVPTLNFVFFHFLSLEVLGPPSPLLKPLLSKVLSFQPTVSRGDSQLARGSHCSEIEAKWYHCPLEFFLWPLTSVNRLRQTATFKVTDWKLRQKIEKVRFTAKWEIAYTQTSLYRRLASRNNHELDRIALVVKQDFSIFTG